MAALAGALGLPFGAAGLTPGGGARSGALPGGRSAACATPSCATSAAGGAAVATGHTADDQVETVLLALLRSTGPAGLAGMAPSRPAPAPGSAGLRLVRPLLGLERAALRPALEALGQSWREDASNLDPGFPATACAWRWAGAGGARPGYRRAVARAAPSAGHGPPRLGAMGAQAGDELFRPDGAALGAERRALLALPPALRAAALRWAVARCAGPPGRRASVRSGRTWRGPWRRSSGGGAGRRPG